MVRNLQIVVSCTYEEGKPALMQDLNFLRQMIEDETHFQEVRSSCSKRIRSRIRSRSKSRIIFKGRSRIRSRGQ